MKLLRAVLDHLAGRGIPCCLIGAAAMARHGVARSTFDVDLLTTEAEALRSEVWSDLFPEAAAEVRRGDASDPLAGVVRLTAPGTRDVDLIVGRYRWQRRVVERAEPVELLGTQVPVARAADLVLLKLFAGGPQDLWDARQLLGCGDSRALVSEVESRVGELPADCQAAWREIGI